MIKEAIKTFIEVNKIDCESESSRSYVFDCPVCGSKKKLYIQKQDGRSVCFRGKDDACPKAGSKPEYALSLISGLEIDRVKRELYEGAVKLKADIDIFQETENQQISTEVAPINGKDLPEGVVPVLSVDGVEGMQYLQKRGITSEIMKKYGIMYSPPMRRVIFPVIMNDQMYGWQGRSIDNVEKHLRMYNLHGEWKSKTLMFYDNLKTSDFAIIAEGAVSALKFEAVGGFVASMGKAISPTQLELIRQSGVKKVYFALDRDAAENTAIIRDYFLKKQQTPIKCFNIEVPEGKGDFGDCTYEECMLAFEEAKEVSVNEIFIHFDEKRRW